MTREDFQTLAHDYSSLSREEALRDARKAAVEGEVVFAVGFTFGEQQKWCLMLSGPALRIWAIYPGRVEIGDPREME